MAERRAGKRKILDRIYYRLDLYGSDGRPSHSKVLTTIGFFAALFAQTFWLVQLSRKADSLSDLGDVISWPYVALVVATLALALGKDTFVRALVYRPGGPGNTAASAAPRTPRTEDFEA